MKPESRAVHVSLAEALTKGPPPPGNLAAAIFSHGTLAVELYTPFGHDPQMAKPTQTKNLNRPAANPGDNRLIQ